MLYDFVRCPRRVVMDRDGPPDRREPPSEFVQLLWDCGVEHEAEIIAGLPNALNVRVLPPAEREQATRLAMAQRVPLIYGARLTHAPSGLVGEPDLLRLAGAGYIPGDIKAGAAEEEEDSGKLVPGYVVQVGHYVNLLERCGLGNGTRDAFIVDGKGKEVAYPLDQPRGKRTEESWWSYYLATLAGLQASLQTPADTLPALAAPCKLCPWKALCKEDLKALDDLTLIAELGRTKRDAMRAQIPTVAALANCNLDQFTQGAKTNFERIGPDTLRRLQDRAKLLSTPGAKPYPIRRTSRPRTRQIYWLRSISLREPHELFF
jgi:predicted RecB family nuclease